MIKTVLIVEDQFVEADYLRLLLTKANYQVTGIARSVIEAEQMIRVKKPGLVLLDIMLKGKENGIDLAKKLKAQNIAYVYLSANSDESVLMEAKTTQPYGFLVKPFREKDLLITLDIAQYRHEHSVESGLQREQLLLHECKSALSRQESWEQKLLTVGRMLQSFVPFDLMWADFDQSGQNSNAGRVFLRIGFDEYQSIGLQELSVIAAVTVKDLEHLKKQGNYSFGELLQSTFAMKSSLTATLTIAAGEVFNLTFFSRRLDVYTSEHLSLIKRLQQEWTKGWEQELFTATNVEQKVDRNTSNILANDFSHVAFKGIIGSSHLLLNVFDLVATVAPTDTSVLILGESGTGKERIAESICELSPRKNAPLIKVNCSALPPTLIESELFGHEKGSFTGAVERRIGKFEQADGGTIFLDEVGELPLDLQVKLLRVLQEREVERIGSRGFIKVDVRIIAATNRNLEKEVAEGRFRLDLYYRLNVFPIDLPSLRERIADVPQLVAHFIAHYNKKSGRKISGISDKALKKLQAYHWPGNIRQLEHLIERNVLLTRSNTIEDILLPDALPRGNEPGPDFRTKTIHENERDHILAVLKKCNGKIWGPGAAAEILNVPPSTLKSKMNKLGIRKSFTE